MVTETMAIKWIYSFNNYIIEGIFNIKIRYLAQFSNLTIWVLLR